MKKILTIICLLTFAITAKAQPKLNTPIPCIFWYSDTSTTWATGAFKYSNASTKRKGYVVYSNTGSGITYNYLDGNKAALNKNYFVISDDQRSDLVKINARLSALENDNKAKQLLIDSLTTKLEQYKAAIPPPITWQFDPIFFLQLPNKQISLKK